MGPAIVNSFLGRSGRHAHITHRDAVGPAGRDSNERQQDPDQFVG